MTGTNLPRKRSEHGGSLIMLVSIIGLAFIVTVAAFLVAASNGHNTARLASAKVDIATREDALMRMILQQTATGMLSGTDAVANPLINWTTIMTSAVTLLRATNYVDPSELAALGLSAATLANTGNIDPSASPLSIFNGFNVEVPFGGTAGLANVVPSPLPSPTVLPPLMNWTGSAPLLSATALTTPQEFFLGSVYTSLSADVTKLSESNRWGRITYPNIRFGYKQPGDTNFIARHVWWRIPVLYQTAQQTVEYQAGVAGGPANINRYPSALANYVLSVYEIPSQLPISGNANLTIGLNADNATAWGSGITIAGGTSGTPGSVYGGQIQLSGGTYKTVSSRNQVNLVVPAAVGTIAYSNNNFDQLGTRETMALTQGIPGAAPVSVVGNDGKVLFVPVMQGNQFYMAVNPLLRVPTNWDLYAQPYYRCRIRIIIDNTTSNLIYNSSTDVIDPTAGAIRVKILYAPDASALPDRILGFQDSAATATPTPWVQTSYGSPNLPDYLTYWSTGTKTGPAPGGSDRNVLIIDVPKMVTELGAASSPTLDAATAPNQLYSIYVGSNQYTEPGNPPSPAYTAIDPAVAIKNTNDLSMFTKGLSIVSNQTLYIMDYFNQGGTVPTSLYAPQLRYGLSGNILSVALTGQISVDPASSGTPGSTPTPAVNPTSLSTASGAQFTPNQANLGEIIDPLLIPPITRMSLLFTIEKERTN